MNPDKNANMKQISDTQNVIRSKFKKAFKNRIECEHSTNRSLEPLSSRHTTKISSAATDLDSHQCLSETLSEQSTQQQQQATVAPERAFKYRLAERNDSNELCNRLRLLVASQIAGKVNNMHEIKSIISELQGHGILV